MIEMLILLNGYITSFKFRRHTYSEDLLILFKNDSLRFLRDIDNKNLRHNLKEKIRYI